MSHKIATVILEGTSPYSQSRYYEQEVPKLEKETGQKYEERTWINRLHTDDKGNILIPPMVFKNCLSEAAKFLGKQIPGKGKSTYTKHFEAGVLVISPLVLPIKKDSIKGEWFFVPSDGVRGSGKRVNKCFPVIPNWTGSVDYIVIDDIIDEKIFAYHLEQAGNFIGIGRFRPRNNGFYGRFSVKDIKWTYKE